MGNYRYRLEPYQGPSSRYTCPSCQKKRQLVRYIDNEQGGHLDPRVGRCNREVNCGYHYTPKQYFADHKPWEKPYALAPNTSQVATKASSDRIEQALFKRSLQGYEQNFFTTYLEKLFNPSKAQQLVTQFYIGTSKHWPGATIFWQIDLEGQVRTGKIMLYGHDGKRIKKPFNHIQWVHRQIQQPNFQLEQCFFGLHQLLHAPSTKAIGLVESEKTAVIATGHFPELVWLGVGSLNQLRPERCKELRDRSVILFPDVGGWKLWKQKAQVVEQVVGGRVLVSDWLEQQADESAKKQGQDLADYLAACPDSHQEAELAL